MLVVSKNKINDLYVTVSDMSSLSSPYYLMELYSNSNLDSKIVRFTGVTSTERIDKFQLEEVSLANEDLDKGKVNLMSASTYDYTIYETPYSTGSSINGLSILERGLLRVEGDSSAVENVYEGKNNVYTFE